MKSRAVRLSLIAIMVLTNVGAAAAAPSPSLNAEGVSSSAPISSPAAAKAVSCPTPTWHVDGWAGSHSTAGMASAIGANWPGEATWQLTDPRVFQGRLRARAGDLSWFSTLDCLAKGNCGLADLGKLFLEVLDWASTNKAELTRWVDLSVQGLPATKVKVRVRGDVDGLLVVSTLGAAASTAKVTADLDVGQGPSGWDSVFHREIADQSVLSAGIYPTTVAEQDLWRDVTLNPGEQLHIKGYLRTDASAVTIPEVSVLAFGVSQFSDSMAGGLFEQVGINIPEPGLKITATIVNVYPAVAVDRPSVFGAVAQVVTNTGSFCDADGDPVTLVASMGTVINNLDGTWTWKYVPSVGEPAVQTVNIDAKDPTGAFSSISFKLIADNTPPITSSIFAGPQGKDNWFRSDVLVTLAATDPAGAGVARTEYSDWGVWRTYSAPLMLSDEGETTFEFRSIDAVGNVEPTQSKIIKIDKTPPTITWSAAPPPNSDGWNRQPVVVDFEASDALSGIDSAPSDQTLASEGVNQSVVGTATDMAGNVASATASGINIDRTPPAVSIQSPKAREYLRTERPVIQWTVTDALSGILTEKGLLDGSPVSNGQVLDESFVSAGPHQLTVGVVDKAGNGGGASVDFTIVANSETLVDSTRRVYEMGWITKRGAYQALHALARAAEAALDRGHPAISVRLLRNYIALLGVFKGRGVNQQAYDRLKGEALYVIGTLQ